ncbi:MAG: DNA primase [Parcubacteria group bacterium Gr01-1014_17]|nr:MAG: DNA primase [Parcubacteria group bacterium Gr01-1014_17]
MSSPVEEIKARLGAEEVVGAYLKLERAGANLKAKCPLHHEKTASFFVSTSRGSFYCFGCGEKGDIFSFVEKMEGVDFKGALKILAERAGVPLTRFHAQENDARDRLFAALEEATRFFEGEFALRADARKYLTERGVLPKTIEMWRIGFAPDSWRALRAHLLAKKFSEQELFRAGLIKQSVEKKGEPYDVFRNRIMFPIFDSAGRVIAFSGRIFGKEEEGTPKYVNSPETEVWRKSSALYGIHRAKHKIRERGYALLVEGQVDLIMCHQAGFENAVAASGTALTHEHLDLLRRFSENLLLAYDVDAAGEKAALRAVSAALQKGMAVKIAALSGGKDPADIIWKNPADFAHGIKNSMHFVRFLFERALTRAKTGRERARLLRDEVLPFVRDIKSAIERAEFVKEIAGALEVREDAVWDDLKRLPVQQPTPNNQLPTNKVGNAVPEAVRLLAGIIFWQEKLPEGERKVDTEKLKEEINAISGKLSLLLSALGENERDTHIFEAEARFAEVPSLEKEVRVLLFHIEKEELERKSAKILNELTVTERGTADEARRMELLTQLQSLRMRIEEIKRASSA